MSSSRPFISHEAPNAQTDAASPTSNDLAGDPQVPATAALVIVEGVGAGRRELSELLDGVVWVQANLEVTRRRDAARIAAGETDQESYTRWMQEELPFVADQRAWERAFAVVAGTPELLFDAMSEVVLGTPPPPPQQQQQQRTA